MDVSSSCDDRLLTVAVVEGLHSAAFNGRTALVASSVAKLTNATLPGLVEYQCLRHATLSTLHLPELPEAVKRSIVGSALSHVVCSFGLRSTGSRTVNSEVNPRSAEFFVLHNEQDCLGRDYALFETRWARASEKVGLHAKQGPMQLAMTAMSENGVLHSLTHSGVLVGYRMLDDAVLFTVADLGCGVLESLKRNPQYVNLAFHRDALRLALRDGVSSMGANGGFGFRAVFKALANQFGTIRFRSGNVCITMDGQNFEADLGEEAYPETLTGFQVTVCCRRAQPLPNAIPAL